MAGRPDHIVNGMLYLSSFACCTILVGIIVRKPKRLASLSVRLILWLLCADAVWSLQFAIAHFVVFQTGRNVLGQNLDDHWVDYLIGCTLYSALSFSLLCIAIIGLHIHRLVINGVPALPTDTYWARVCLVGAAALSLGTGITSFVLQKRGLGQWSGVIISAVPSFVVVVLALVVIDLRRQCVSQVTKLSAVRRLRWYILVFLITWMPLIVLNFGQLAGCVPPLWAHLVTHTMFALTGVNNVVVYALNQRCLSCRSSSSELRSGRTGSLGSHLQEMKAAEVEIDRQIGSGAGGVVYKGVWRGTRVAIKKVPLSSGCGGAPGRCSERERVEAALASEAAQMVNLRHPNIVLFMGACLEMGSVCILTEYCARGSLYDVLRATPHLSLATRCRLALGAAQGLQYLHSATPPLIHRDVKSPNILVDEAWTAKIADFGTLRMQSVIKESRRRRGSLISRSMRASGSGEDLGGGGAGPGGGSGGGAGPGGGFARGGGCGGGGDGGGGGRHDPSAVHMMTAHVGTLRWSPPELLCGAADETGKVSTGCCPEKVDIYSFGLVLYELVTGEIPFSELRFNYEVERAVLRGERPSLPPGACPAAWEQLYLDCTAACACQRPSARQVVDRLQAMYDEWTRRSFNIATPHRDSARTTFTDTNGMRTPLSETAARRSLLGYLQVTRHSLTLLRKSRALGKKNKSTKNPQDSYNYNNNNNNVSQPRRLWEKLRQQVIPVHDVDRPSSCGYSVSSEQLWSPQMSYSLEDPVADAA